MENNRYQLKVAIRDDDLSFYSNPKDIESIYGNYYGKLPISFGVVPFISEISRETFKNEDGTIYIGPEKNPISENKELVSYIINKIKNKEIYLALHGCDHRYFVKDGKVTPEFIWKDFETLRREVGEGKRYIESLFSQKIECFIPPHNGVSPAAVMALAQNDIFLINAIPSSKIFGRKISPPYLLFMIKRFFYKATHIKKPYSIYPEPFGQKIKEKSAVLLKKWMSFDDMRGIVDMYKKERVGSIVIATHHYELAENKEFKKNFKMLLDYLLKPDVKFINLKEAFYG